MLVYILNDRDTSALFLELYADKLLISKIPVTIWIIYLTINIF